jgi:ABC-type transport system involved in multi-copper enzyme maturation permease subunit
MKCLIWRQHRWQLLWTCLFLAVLCGLSAWVGVRASQWITNYNAWLRLVRSSGCPLPGQRGSFTVPASCHDLLQRYPNGFQVAFGNAFNFAIPAFEEGVPLALAVIGALVGAPLVAREIEQRTQLVSWTQSATRRRWFVTKVVVIAAALAAVGLVAGVVTGRLEHPLTQGGLTSSRWVWFYSSNLALAGEIVLTFALAVALGAWLRRTLPAMVAAWFAFLPLLFGAGFAVRNLTPTQRTNSPSHIAALGGGWGIQSGHGALYHPAGQYWPLQVAFLVILLALAAATLAAGWYATRTRAV